MKTIAALLTLAVVLVLSAPTHACPLPGAGQVLYDPSTVAPAGCGVTAGASFSTYSSGMFPGAAFFPRRSFAPIGDYYAPGAVPVPGRAFFPRRSFAPGGGGFVPTPVPIGGLNVNVNSFNQGRRFLRR